MKNNFSRGLLFLMLAMATGSAMAAEIVKNVRIRDGREKLYFNLFQSVVEPTLWYCGQVKPQVLLRSTEKPVIPEISLVRFQRRDAKNSEKLHQGAIFRMHLGLGPGEKSFAELRKTAEKKSRGKAVRLSPVPFAALKLCLQKPDGTEVEMKPESLSGISNRHTSQNVAFSVTLDSLQADLLDELVSGATGAKYNLYYNYKYIEPLLSSAGGRTGTSPVREFDAPLRTGKVDGRVLPGSRDFDKMEREAEAKAGWELAGQGFVGFSGYEKEVRDRCIFVETNPDLWENAYLTLPLVQPPSQLSVEKIELEVTIIAQNKSFGKTLLSWTPEKKWRDSHGAPLVYAVFDIAPVRSRLKDVSQAKFFVKQTIVSNKTDVLRQNITLDLLVGDNPVSNPLNLADLFEIQTGFLSWSETENSGLQAVEVSLKQGDWTSQRTIKPEKKSGKLMIPDVNQWLISSQKTETVEPLGAQLYFVVAENGESKRVAWRHNDKNLLKESSGTSWILLDNDWQQK